MALVHGVCHSVFISTNLKQSNTVTINLPYEDIKSNLWQISLNQISQNFKKASNILTGISCSFVTDITYNKDHQIVNNNPILWQTTFKGNVNEIKLMQYNQNWFYVTNADSVLTLKFWRFVDGVKKDVNLDIDCDIYMTLLIQRVR